MTHRNRVLGLVGGIAASLVGTATLEAAIYADATKVDLLRRVDASGNFIVGVAWANYTGNGGYIWPGMDAYQGVDMGSRYTQLSFSSQSASNTGQYRISLPEAVSIGAISHVYAGWLPTQYRLWGSMTGFTGMTDLTAGWKPASSGNGPYTDTVNTTAKYLEYEFLGTASGQHLVLEEIKAFAPAGAAIPLDSGYNLFDQRAAAGPIPNNSLYRSAAGTWQDDPNSFIDLSQGSYLRGKSAGDAWVVIPLNDSYHLVGAAIGLWHDQNWANGIKIEYTNDAALSAGTTWNLAFSNSSMSGSTMLPFATPVQARFLKVTDIGGYWGAVTEFEAYFIPEPAALSLLALGGLVLLRRRRRA